MSRSLFLMLLALLLGGCATREPESSPSMTVELTAAAERGENTVTGYYYTCDFEDQAYTCPSLRGQVFPTRAEAEAELEEHLAAQPEHRRTAVIREMDVEVPRTP